ncbi:alpha/beta hydrolase [Yinghuangia seranimata]|uniref:alpha/beta hydrolase n=1 Tax=Yinghuangia seranimata TaxID=408067 RepID=UPI00248B4056|nr:alpha/beta fold hydrolase [Yinghuangia seranimata]MDI2126127.1 alpha/beta fold hydrolase [Yinghuangia seranimata]
MSILPGAEPYQHDGGPVGFLLSHGFTGTPQSMRPWAEHLAAAGLTVSLPLLPGHGTRWQDMALTTWQDWYAEVERAFDALRERCETVFVGGLSMGGTLALRLAELRGDQVAGLVLVNPSVHADDPRLKALPVLKHLAKSVAGIGSDIRKEGVVELAYSRTPLKPLHSLVKAWPVVQGDLPQITQPVLLFRSPQDHVVAPANSETVLARISSTDVTAELLPDSYHVATLDHDAERIFTGSLEFVRRVAAFDGKDGDDAKDDAKD